MSYGVLYVVSTPIGNLEDFSLRAISTLNKSKVISIDYTTYKYDHQKNELTQLD